MNKDPSSGSVNETSFLDCVNKLVECNSRHPRHKIHFGQEREPVRLEQKRLKQQIFNAFFDGSVRKKYKQDNMSCQLLFTECWDVKTTCKALLFRMCATKRKYEQSEKLNQLFESSMKDEKNFPILTVLLSLSDTNCLPNYDAIGQPDGEAKIDSDIVIKYGDTRTNLFTKAYCDYPESVFIGGQYESPFMSVPQSEQFLTHEMCYQTFENEMLNGRSSIKGLKSSVFGIKGLPDDSFTKKSQETLYGGLSHSRTTSMNISLSLPDIKDQLDICRIVGDKDKFDEDEGFVSCGSTPSPKSPSTISLTQDEAINPNVLLYKNNEPYWGYRAPKYDLREWENTLKIKRSNHRSWETIGKFAGSTKQRRYFTEAGPCVFDKVWKNRWQIVLNLATALHARSGSKTAPPPSKYEWLEMEEADLVQNSVLVTVGISSETFQLNTLAHMFLANKKVHVRGVTAPSIWSVLSRFAEYGTCYWRLLRFTSAGISTFTNPAANATQPGVIFKAFCDGIRRYLHGFQQNALIHKEVHFTLQQLALSFERLGSQIRYICQLCMCGTPDSPQEHISSLVHPDFPQGVNILSYLYEEALHCTQTSDYLVLLYLLRKCCQPYLQFVQTWVFRGSCWDTTGEFLLRVNVENSCKRDRRRWCNYIEAANPADVTSCVPTFLAPVANDIFTCGKTIELLQLICPEHFLCTHLVSVPRILVTFSTTRMQQFLVKWRKFEDETKQLEQDRTTKWQEREKELKDSRRRDIVRARELFEEQMAEANLERDKVLLAIRKEKLVELERLKQQAKDEKDRKTQERLNEKEADALWVRQVADRENREKLHEENVLKEAREALIAHYDELGQEAERRRVKAEWQIRRHRLQQKRTEFHQNDVWTHFDGNSPHPVKPTKPESTDGRVDTSVQITPGNDSESPEHNISGISNADEQVTPKEQRTDTEKLSGIEEQPSKITPTIPDEESAIKSTQPVESSLNKPHVSQETVESEFVPHRRPVDQQHVTESTIFSPAFQEVVSSGAIPDHHVTESTMATFLTDSVAPTGDQRLTKMMVADQHVSKSSVGEMFSSSADNRNRASIAQVMGQHVTDSTMPDILCDQASNPSTHYRATKMMVSGQHVTKSSVGAMLVDQSGDKRVAPSILRNIANKHSSQSIVQDLMYYECEPAVEKESLTPASCYASQSTVQDLMYPAPNPTSPERVPKNSEETNESFSLKLPSTNGYQDTLDSVRGRLLSGQKVLSARDTEPYDLYRSVMGDFSGLYTNDDDDDTDDVLGLGAADDVTVDFHALPILLRNCVLRPIKSHASLVNRCIVNHFMADLDLPRHFEALRHFLLFEDGEFAQNFSIELFELVHSGGNPSALLNPISLDSILTRAIQASAQHNSNLARGLSLEIKSLPPAFSSIDLFVLDCVELRYNVEWPYNIVITESSHAKYNKVMSFLLQLKHVVWALHDICKRLNKIACGRSVLVKMEASEVRKLHICRHEMHNFVKVMQGYVSTQVLHVCWQEFQEALKSDANNLDELHLRHAEYINRCVLRCLLTPKAQNVMNVICDALKCILRFRAQLSSPASANFATLHRTYRDFTRFSNFLFRVVSKLVERGYQPHLEDFLLRLNFNGFYKT